MKKLVIGAVGAVLIADAALVLSGYQILFGEHRIGVGQHAHVSGVGDVYSDSQASLVCTYWTGRSVKAELYRYSPNSVAGRDECSFLLRPEDS